MSRSQHKADIPRQRGSAHLMIVIVKILMTIIMMIIMMMITGIPRQRGSAHLRYDDDDDDDTYDNIGRS